MAVSEARIAELGAVLCAVGASLGAVEFIAWLIPIRPVLTLLPGLPPMTPNSAVGALLLGIAGALVVQKQTGRFVRLLVMSAAIVVLAISIGTVTEYALGTQLFFDQLFRDRIAPYYQGSLSSPPAAVAFIFLSAGILLFNSEPGKRFHPSELLILTAAFIAITALMGYLYGVSSAYELTGPPVTARSIRVIRAAGDLLIVGISFFTAVSLFLISAGLFLGQRDWGTVRIMAGPGPGGLLFRRLTPVAILMPIGFGVVASRLPGTGDNPVVLAGLTGATTILSLSLLGITALHIDDEHDDLEQQRKRARDLINLASDGILTADVDGQVTEVNEVLHHLLGYSREELLTKNIRDLIPPQDEERLWKHRDQLLEGFTNIDEWTVVRKDGSRFSTEVSAKILPDRRWQAIVHDISKHKRAEEALRQSADTARHATQARDDMLGLVVHDLRNPLSAIYALARVLRRTGSEHELADELAYAAERMNRLIRDLVDVSLLDAGTFSIKQERVATRDILSEVVRSQSVLTAPASLKLRLEAASKVPDVWADHDRLLQVFENLVGNAIKCTEPGGLITVCATAKAGEILFSVKDTGRGIRADQLPHVFDRFWQAPESKRHGAGLGLSIVKGVVETHGGHIWVESSPGQGTTFFFTIPIAQMAQGDSASSTKRLTA
jgi:PAS domain S-box-containing protein